MTPGLGLPALVICAALVGGCSANTPNPKATYTFDPSDAPVQVDSAELRQQKAQAGIDDCPPTSDVATVDGGLPDITLPCLGGGRDVRLAGLREAPTVINFWAQTCGPCRTETPFFQRLHELAGEEVEVIGVDWQDSRPGYALAFADELGLTYPQTADPEAATRAPMRIAALPVTFFVGEDGVVEHTEYGAIDSLADLAGLIEEHLGVRLDLDAA